MNMAKDKKVIVAADVAGFHLKEAIVTHLVKKGWEITDVGCRTPDNVEGVEMFHRMAIRLGAYISEGEFERGMVFCGTGMGVHLAVSKCPGVQCAVVESVPAALRAITGNGVNVMAMGGHYIAHQMGIEIAEAFLYNKLGSGYEWWNTFYEFHKFAHDEIDSFDYQAYKANNFKFPDDYVPELKYDAINSGPEK